MNVSWLSSYQQWSHIQPPVMHLDVRGTPRYLKGSLPRGGSKNWAICNLIGSEIPARYSAYLEALAWRPDAIEKISSLSHRILIDLASPLQNNIRSSTKHRWLSLRPLHLGGKLKCLCSPTTLRVLNIFFISMTKRSEDSGSPCLRPLLGVKSQRGCH